MNAPHGFGKWFCCLFVTLGASAQLAVAHTLPISYLRLVTDDAYLHFELIFNPFELTFMSELDDNHDAELSPTELTSHGQAMADRVVGAFKFTAGGKALSAETAGIDPDVNGHHVRLRAHYRVDARHVPLTMESDFKRLTSGSHLTQISYVNSTNTQMAQLDSQSHVVTFESPHGQAKLNHARATVNRSAISATAMTFAVLLLLIIGAVTFSLVRKQLQP